MNNSNDYKMKILLFIPGMNRGGAERVVAFIANELIKLGHEVSILVLNKADSEYELNNKINLIGLNTNKTNKLGLLYKLRKTIHKISPTVIICFSIKMTIYTILATIGKKSKIIGSDRSNPYYAYGNRMNRGLYFRILTKASGFIFLTEGGKNYYPEIIREKSVVIPNGVFADNIPRINREYKLRDKQMVCAIGRLSPVKNYKTMLKAFSLFIKNHPSHTLYIFGDGELRSELHKLSKELNIERSVVFEGKVENITSRINNAAMFIHTSKSESWCNALMEAMACGIPSVVMDCDFGPRAMIKHEYNGELVALDDLEGFSASMSKIADSDDYAEFLSENAFKINTTHNPDVILQKYLNYIEGIAYEN